LWGLLFGAIFGLPVAGVAVGAVAGLVRAKLGQLSLEEDVVERLKGQITPGTAAMFVLSSDAVRPKVRAAFQGQQAELLYSNLEPAEQEELERRFEQDS